MAACPGGFIFITPPLITTFTGTPDKDVEKALKEINLININDENPAF